MLHNYASHDIVILTMNLPSLLRRRSIVCECVCPFVSEPSKLTSSKVMHVFVNVCLLSVSLPSLLRRRSCVNVYVLLSVSLPTLLHRRSIVCECVCPFVSEPSKLTSSKVMCL